MHKILLCLFLCIGLSVQAREMEDLRSFGDLSTSTLYVFTAPNCPHCRDFHKIIFPELLKRYVNTKKAQIVMVDMGYDPATLEAILLMRCLPAQKSEKMTNWLYENQSKWMKAKNPSILFRQYTNALGMSQNELKACLGNEHLKEVIEQQRDTISALYGVRAWPTIALRQGNTVKIYTGTDKREILYGIDSDIKSFQEEMRKHQK